MSAFRAVGSWLESIDAKAAQKAADGETPLAVLDAAREVVHDGGATGTEHQPQPGGSSAAGDVEVTLGGVPRTAEAPVALGPLARTALDGTGAEDPSSLSDPALAALRKSVAALDAAGGLSGAWPRQELQQEFESCLAQVREQWARAAALEAAAEEQAQSAALAEELYAAELQQVREESARGAGERGVAARDAREAAGEADAIRERAEAEAAAYRRAMDEARAVASERLRAAADSERAAIAEEGVAVAAEREADEIEAKFLESGEQVGTASAVAAAEAEAEQLEAEAEELRARAERIDAERTATAAAAARQPLHRKPAQAHRGTPAEREAALERRVVALTEELAAKEARVTAIGEERATLRNQLEQVTARRREIASSGDAMAALAARRGTADDADDAELDYDDDNGKDKGKVAQAMRMARRVDRAGRRMLSQRGIVTVFALWMLCLQGLVTLMLLWAQAKRAVFGADEKHGTENKSHER